jgi:hypothetical protein
MFLAYLGTGYVYAGIKPGGEVAAVAESKLHSWTFGKELRVAYYQCF